jgi:hypothetical protein
MSRYLRPFALLPLAALSCIVDARPYPLGTGMAASADSAQTASSNPAGISRFAERAMSAEILFFNSESEWESEFSGIGNRFDTKDSGETVVAGQRVAAGTMLARLDPRGFETRVMLEQAQLNLARADFERFSRLIRSRASPVSEAEVDRRRSLFEMAEVRTAQAWRCSVRHADQERHRARTSRTRPCAHRSTAWWRSRWSTTIPRSRSRRASLS